jgi:hypothetical protein
MLVLKLFLKKIVVLCSEDSEEDSAMYSMTDEGKKAYLDSFPRKTKPGGRAPASRDIDQSDMKILRALLNGQLSERQIQDVCDFPIEQRLTILCSKGYVEKSGGSFYDS